MDGDSGKPDIYNIQETSTVTRTPVTTLRYWRPRGEGPESFKIGRRVMYRRADVEEWLERQYRCSNSSGAA